MIKSICHFYCKLRGWQVINKTPKELKLAVVIGYPHTSNWDFPTAMFAIKDQKLDYAKFGIKKEWLKPPFGWILRSLGAIGIDRSKNKDISSTKILADLFNNKEKLHLMIAPEGTRSRREKWRTGFYHIAQMANVPIILFKARYDQRIIYIGEKIIYPTDFEKDMIEITQYLKDGVGAIDSNASVDLRFDK